MKCKFCGKEFSRPCGLKVHENTCKANPNKILYKHVCNFPGKIGKGNWICSICNKVLETKMKMRNHRIDEHNFKFDKSWNKGLTSKTDERVKQCGETYSKNYSDGKFEIHRHVWTKEEREKRSQFAKEHNFGGWHTSKTIDYNGIKLDSSYEYSLAKLLDEKKIKWLRPKFLFWEDKKRKFS